MPDCVALVPGPDVVLCRRHGGSALIRFHCRRGPEFLCPRLTPRSYINAQDLRCAAGWRAGCSAVGMTAQAIRSGHLFGKLSGFI